MQAERRPGPSTVDRLRPLVLLGDRLAQVRGLDAAHLATLPQDEFRRRTAALLEDEYVNNKRKVGFLERKIVDDVAVPDIAKAEVPRNAGYDALAARMVANGIPVERT